jgi:V/A-type H+/Na+-transporting ATPase subunit K
MARNKLSTLFVSTMFICATSFLLPAVIYAAEGAPVKAGADWMGLAYIGAGLAVGLACIASGIAVARIGSAAIGAVSEKPELMGRTLVFLGLAEGIAIYGLIIAIMILNKL